MSDTTQPSIRDILHDYANGIGKPSDYADATDEAEQALLALILAARPEQKTWNGVNDESGKVAAAYILALDQYTEAIQALFRKDGEA